MLGPQKITQHPLVSNIRAQVDPPTHISNPPCMRQATAAAVICFFLLTDQRAPLQQGGQGAEKPLNGSEGWTAPNSQLLKHLQPQPSIKRSLLSNQTTHLKFVSWWPDGFSPLEKPHMSAHPCIIFYLCI